MSRRIPLRHGHGASKAAGALRTLLVAGLAATLPAGCGSQAGGADGANAASTTPAGDAAPATSAAPAASGAPAASATSAASAAPVVPSPTGSSGYVFSFTSLQPEQDDPRVLDWLEDPCGMTPVARVETMPINDPSLAPDWVVEFTADGRELRRWGKPYGAEIRGIVGERLHFRITGLGGADYWTDLDGRIGQPGPLEPAVGPLEASDTTCPALPTFEGSDYELCYDVIDGVGKTRKLAWEGACS